MYRAYVGSAELPYGPAKGRVRRVLSLQTCTALPDNDKLRDRPLLIVVDRAIPHEAGQTQAGFKTMEATLT